MTPSTHLPRLVTTDAATHSAEGHAEASVTSFEDLYRDHFAFVWRSAKRLGAPEASLDDVAQEVFVIAHRRLADFEGRSSLKTWLFGITLRVARDHRRSAVRKNREQGGDKVDPDALRSTAPGPSETLEKSQAVSLLYALLDEMDAERREIFVMAELEQMTMPDIASTLGLNLNTAYARLRAARQDFEAGVARAKARDQWRLR